MAHDSRCLSFDVGTAASTIKRIRFCLNIFLNIFWSRPLLRFIFHSVSSPYGIDAGALPPLCTPARTGTAQDPFSRAALSRDCICCRSCISSDSLTYNSPVDLLRIPRILFCLCHICVQSAGIPLKPAQPCLRVHVRLSVRQRIPGFLRIARHRQ